MGDTQAFFDAIRAGDTGSAAQMLDRDPSLAEAKNPQGVSAVLMACYTGRKEIRDLLIERGAKLELDEAVAAGKLAQVQQLVEANPASAGGYSPDGFPLLALAAAFGHEEVVRYLYGQGADLNAISKNGTGYTALTGAVAGRHPGVARWLVENGAQVNYRYAKGHSPLLEAAANGSLDIVKILLAHGADPQAKTDEGKSALDFAEQAGHTELATYLRDLGLTA
jgi:ankyrin repeat protein